MSAERIDLAELRRRLEYGRGNGSPDCSTDEVLLALTVVEAALAWKAQRDADSLTGEVMRGRDLEDALAPFRKESDNEAGS